MEFLSKSKDLRLALLRPCQKSLGRTLVFFDAETTEGVSRYRGGDIIQLAAISGGHTFNVYMMPEVAIDRRVTAVTGFKVQNGQLSQNDLWPKATVTLHKALSSFITFLRSLEQPVLLAAHDAKIFHKSKLNSVLFRCGLTEQFEQLGLRFLDTLLLSNALFPRLGRYDQESLSYPFLGKTDNDHNALENVRALQELYGFWNPDQECVIQCSF